MLTINADAHPLMNLFHKPTDEKRMVIILLPERYRDWLSASPENSMAFMQPCSANLLQAMPATPPRSAQANGKSPAIPATIEVKKQDRGRKLVEFSRCRHQQRSSLSGSPGHRPMHGAAVVHR